MGTRFTEIYDKSLSKMREYLFTNMENADVYNALSPYLSSVESDFSRISIESLTEKDANGYSATLSADGIEIMAVGIVYYWMTAYVADSDKLRNTIGTKDFNTFSPANLLQSIESVRGDFEIDYRSRMCAYSFVHGDLSRHVTRR